MELSNKKVLITGSTDGLGKELAKSLIGKGSQVVIHGREESKVKHTVEELGALEAVICDFNNPQTIANAFSKIKKLDILINNAGVWLEGDTVGASHEKIMEIINVNLSSHLGVTRILLPVLQKAEFGQVLNVVSIAGIEIPSGYYHTIYSAAKFGMQAFSEATAKEFHNKNLRVMGFYPGGMETKIFDKAGNDYKGHEPWMFDPKESVEAIIFMLTRDSKINVKRLDLVNHLEK